MINPSAPKNISFRVETLFTQKNGKHRVGTLKPDENGVYKGLPLMVMGETTQQNTYYDPQSMVDQITNPQSRFNIVYRQGKLFGEYGHPDFHTYTTDNDKLQRLTTVDERMVSHLFTGLYTDAPSKDGTVVVRGDLKPTGPYGKVFKESLDDPMVNTAFSLRAFVSTDVRPNGLKYRTVRSLTTWDTVGASGFFSTDKSHALGLESFAGDQFHQAEIGVMENGNLLIDQVALETFNNTDLNEIFGTTSVAKIIQSRTIVKIDPELSERFPTLYQRSVFNDYLKDI